MGKALSRKRGKKRGRTVEEAFRLFLGDLLRVGAGLVLLHLFVFQFSVVRGTSMYPNIEEGDRLLVDRLTYNLGEVDRFDVVILRSPMDPSVDFVKRVVGLPGDEIEIRNGRLWVWGKALEEPYARIADPQVQGSWRVPMGCYFVLGDNRPVSSDSREGWYVKEDLIKGKVRARVWPLFRAKVF